METEKKTLRKRKTAPSKATKEDDAIRPSSSIPSVIQPKEHIEGHNDDNSSSSDCEENGKKLRHLATFTTAHPSFPQFLMDLWCNALVLESLPLLEKQSSQKRKAGSEDDDMSESERRAEEAWTRRKNSWCFQLIRVIAIIIVWTLLYGAADSVFLSKFSRVGRVKSEDDLIREALSQAAMGPQRGGPGRGPF